VAHLSEALTLRVPLGVHETNEAALRSCTTSASFAMNPAPVIPRLLAPLSSRASLFLLLLLLLLLRCAACCC
jgi:hypothetical protein